MHVKGNFYAESVTINHYRQNLVYQCHLLVCSRCSLRSVSDSAACVDRQIEALVEDKYVNHVKMAQLDEQRARLACEVECLKAAAKSSTQSEQKWKGLYISLVLSNDLRTCCKLYQLSA